MVGRHVTRARAPPTFGATPRERLWHSILPDQDFFGDVIATAGTGQPWHDGGQRPAIEDVACAADSEGDLHALVVTSDGRLWHTIRRANGGGWLEFGNVESGGAGNIGTVTAVAAATEGRKLHIVAVNSAGELHRTVWNPETPTDPARFDPPFTMVGTWDPAKGPLELVAASFWSPRTSPSTTSPSSGKVTAEGSTPGWPASSTC